MKKIEYRRRTSGMYFIAEWNYDTFLLVVNKKTC